MFHFNKLFPVSTTFLAKITQQMLLNIIPVILSDGINHCSYIYFVRQYLTSQLGLVICTNVILDIMFFISLCFSYITNTKVILKKRFLQSRDVYLCATLTFSV